MRRPILFLIWFAGAIGTTLAAPTRPLYEPPPTPETPALDFRGTQWFGTTYEGKPWIIVFHVDGRVTNTDNGSEHKYSGTWKATGNAVYMELHKKYYEFNGTVQGDVLDGDSRNVTGLRWKTTFRRVASIK